VIYVIGSGPAGLTCAAALIDLGLPVTMLDSGVLMEPDRRARMDALVDLPRSEWPADTIKDLRHQPPVGLGGVPLKFSYGSDFPYHDVSGELPFENQGTAIRPTLARGGFSTVWGSCILPYLQEDISDWPISIEDLAPHYRAVCEIIPVSGENDSLAELLPLYTDRNEPLRQSRQARALMEDMARARKKLRAREIHFGQSRLAVRAGASPRGGGCEYCGLCLYGCPRQLIYDASTTLEELQSRDDFHYVPDVVVERFAEVGGSVKIEARNRVTAERIRIDAERVYLAAGTVSTTRLILDSTESFDRPIEMRDSQYFLLPWLRLRRSRGAATEDLHTLSQIFIELRDAVDSDRSAHLQIYTYNDHYAALFERLLGPAASWLRMPLNFALERMLLIQGYLHSHVSPTIIATLRRSGERSVLEMEARPNPRCRPTLRRIVARLFRSASAFGAVPVWPALQVAPPGRGFHTGGTLPMRERPAELETDVLGRPKGFERLHVVDSSVLPSIPPTTITLTVMANAHRIASAHHEL